MTTETINNPTAKTRSTDKQAFIEAVAADRLAGMSYRKIGLKYQKSVPSIRDTLIVARSLGIDTGLHVQTKRNQDRPTPDAVYDTKWMQRVLSGLKVELSGCWTWQGLRSYNGYGSTSYRVKTKAVHRVFYELLNGVKLDRWQLVCHKCDRPNCINPDHLWVGDAKVNMIDAGAKRRWPRQVKTHCANGHERIQENLRLDPPNKWTCRLCERDRQRAKWRGPRKAELLARQRMHRQRRRQESLAPKKDGQQT